MPTFEPVAWQATRNGFICKENKNPEYNIGLFTESQLQQAYQTGKRDAVPEDTWRCPCCNTDLKHEHSYECLAAAPKGEVKCVSAHQA